VKKRKAQNRAAQRAFRERKEKHLKDLETKVSELEKLSESQDHENSLLRAQVERQQTELREYKKRLSVQPPPSVGSFPMPSTSTTSSNMIPNSFAFDFPQFSSLSYLPIDTSSGQGLFDLNLTASPTVASRHGSTDFLSSINMAPSPSSTDPLRSLHSSISGGSPMTNPTNNSSNNGEKVSNNTPSIWGMRDYNIFMPSASPQSIPSPVPQPQKAASNTSQTQHSDSGDSHVRSQFRFNPGDISSPSTTTSQNGPSSSCETSPESTAHATTSIKEEQTSPAPGKAIEPELLVNVGTGADQQFGMFSSANVRPTGAENQPLWIDMPTTNMMGDGSFTGGFFNDTMPGGAFDYTPMDWSDLIGGGSSMKTGLTPAISSQNKTNPMEDVRVMPSIAEEQHPMQQDTIDHSEMAGKMCNKIW
jgi:AP-1-like factor